jgi:hypothetical protein
VRILEALCGAKLADQPDWLPFCVVVECCLAPRSTIRSSMQLCSVEVRPVMFLIIYGSLAVLR